MPKPEWKDTLKSCEKCGKGKKILVRVWSTHKTRVWTETEHGLDKVDDIQEWQWWCLECINKEGV